MRKSRDSARNTEGLRDVGEGSVREGGRLRKRGRTGGKSTKKSRDRLELIAAFRGVRR